MSRLASALNSKDLTHEEADCDVDVVRAAGLTSISKSLGMLIVEARESAAGESSHSIARIRALEACLWPYIQRWARRWSIRLSPKPVASQIVRELILDRCFTCQGRGFIPMRYDGNREEEVNIDCSICLGSGQARRDYRARAKSAGHGDYSKYLAEWWEAALTRCAEAEADARGAFWRRLKK